MSATILLLGPSGIGKTTLLKHFTAKVRCISGISMDNVAHRYARELGLISAKDDLNALINALDADRDRFLQFGIEAIDLYRQQQPDKAAIIDVGTGFLDAAGSLEWVTTAASISIWAEPASAFDRFRKARNLDISYEQYVSTQYSKSRQITYNKAATVIKTEGLDETTTAHRFACCTFGYLPQKIAAIALKEWLL